MRRGLSLFFVCLLTPASFTMQGQAISRQAISNSPDLPAAAQSAYKQGADYEQRQQLGSALDSYKAAQKQAGQSLDCLRAIQRVQMKMESYKDAAATGAKMASLAHDPKEKAAAEFLEGQALYGQSLAYTAGAGNYDKNPRRALESLKQAQDVLARGAVDDPNNEPLLMLYGRILAALHQDDEARREFTACAAVAGTSPAECARARRLSSNIDSARNEPVPPFELKTIDGETVSRDSLAGKVVLVDFWATWCPACRSDSGYVQSLLDSFHDGRFVLLEVDVDENRSAWVQYLNANRLKGTQTRDDDKSAQFAFHISAFPTYIVIDGNGSVRMRALGTEGDLRGTIRQLLAEQQTAQDTSSAMHSKPAE